MFSDRRFKLTISFLFLFLFLFMASCVANSEANTSANQNAYDHQEQEHATASLTPFQPLLKTVTPEKSDADLSSPELTKLWLSPSVPQDMFIQMEPGDDLEVVENEADSHFSLRPVSVEESSSDWFYVLVAPFPTLEDEVELKDITSVWNGETSTLFGGSSLYLSPETKAAFESQWGPASLSRVIEIAEEDLLDYCWSHRPSWALIPFELLEPQWKVIRVDGVSLFDVDFESVSYPLVIHFGFLDAQNQIIQPSEIDLHLPETNFDRSKMTSVMLTGVTALVRATGAKMEENGMDYPGELIKDWMLNVDFTHVSNEVSFSPDCPAADPYQIGLRFCSRPEYYELLEDMDVDVVELSGNHLLDWSQEAFEYTLDLYHENEMPFYAGGINESEAREPYLIEHHGNKIAFLGCNPAGPEKVWATDEKPGAANCEDYSWIKDEIAILKADGYLPIVTLQYNEHYAITPTDFQKRDFPPLIDAGAVIVSGSQAHFPNGMGFRDGYFIHYGLGNLFFDQMDFLFPGVQREFLDVHYFYEGKYINTVLLTAELEDYAQPRPMTSDERRLFLEEAFKASGW